jgi:hypothetical protein
MHGRRIAPAASDAFEEKNERNACETNKRKQTEVVDKGQQISLSEKSPLIGRVGPLHTGC